MTDERLAHLRDITSVLWPSPYEAGLGRGGRRDDRDVAAEFVVLPGRERPRLLAPATRRAAAAVARFHGEGRQPAARLRAAGVALALQAGAHRWLWRDRLVISAPRGTGGETLIDHLADRLGRDLVIGMHLGPARANRKPVLQLLTPEGRTFAYAKLSVDDLTEDLVRTETRALATLAGVRTRTVEAPTVHYTGRWRGHELLVQSALPVWSARSALTEERLTAAAAEIAAIGRVDGVRLGSSPFWQGLNERVDRLPGGPAAERLGYLLRCIAAVAGDDAIGVGSSHGDWTPWNMACLADRLLVWDWERFRSGVPLGFDLLHHRMQDEVVRRVCQPPESARRMVDDAPARLGPLGLTGRLALLTALLYGADLAARYLADRQMEAGARLGDVDAWLLPALAGGLSRLEEID